MPHFHNPQDIRTLKAGAALSEYRIVKPGADDDHILEAAANTDALIGIVLPGQSTDPSDAFVAEDPVDFATGGTARVEYGGTITRGAQLTADSQGRAVSTTTNAHRVIGTALVSGVVGDLGSCLIDAGTL